MSAIKKPVKFEVALRRLEAIVEKLEGGDLGLDDALQAFADGTEMARTCEAKLAEAETKVATLLGKKS